MAQVIKGKDINGNAVQMTVDLSKDLIIENIPDELEWELKTIDEHLVSETTEWIGGRERRG